MNPATDIVQGSMSQMLDDLHTRVAATILGLDEAALSWQPGPTMQSVRDLIRYAAAEERRWIGEGVAGIPVTDEGRYAMIQLSSGQPADQSLFELGTAGQASHMILTSLAPADWSEMRQVGGRSTTVAGCVLQTLIELARVLGHIESTCRMWDTSYRRAA